MEKKKSKLVLSIIIFIVLFAAYIFSGMLFPEGIKKDIVSGTLVVIGIKIIISVLAFVALRKLYDRNFNINGKCLGKGIFWYDLPAILLMIFMFIQVPESTDKSLGEAMPLILVALAANMTVGIFEESLCRGFLFNAMRSDFGEDKKGVMKAAFLSSFIFGIAHLPNMKDGIFWGTIAQVIYAVMMGVLFCAIYYRTDNLLVTIIIHGLIDFASEFWSCFVSAEPAAEDSLGGAIVQVVIILPMLIAGLLQFRKAFKSRNEEQTDRAVQTA